MHTKGASAGKVDMSNKSDEITGTTIPIKTSHLNNSDSKFSPLDEIKHPNSPLTNAFSDIPSNNAREQSDSKGTTGENKEQEKGTPEGNPKEQKEPEERIPRVTKPRKENGKKYDKHQTEKAAIDLERIEQHNAVLDKITSSVEELDDGNIDRQFAELVAQQVIRLNDDEENLTPSDKTLQKKFRNGKGKAKKLFKEPPYFPPGYMIRPVPQRYSDIGKNYPASDKIRDFTQNKK